MLLCLANCDKLHTTKEKIVLSTHKINLFNERAPEKHNFSPRVGLPLGIVGIGPLRGSGNIPVSARAKVNLVAFCCMAVFMAGGIMLVVVIMTTASAAAGMSVFDAVASHDAPRRTLVRRVFCATASSTEYMRSNLSESFLAACMI